MTLTVGVDVGGTKMAAGVVDEHGHVLDRAKRPSPSEDAEELLAAICDLVGELRGSHDLAAVGVGAAGFVSSDRRRVLFAPHLQWGPGPQADQLESELGIPVVIENDANAAAWAEFRFGAGQGVLDQLMVAVGTGVGGGIILNGEPHRGHTGVGAEIGHINHIPGGRPCPCGRLGCWEQYASGSALERDAQAAAAEGRAPLLLERAGGNAAQVSGRLVSELAQSGEPEAVQLLNDLGERLGHGIATLVSALDPGLVLLGGGVSESGGKLLEAVRASLDTQITGRGHRDVPPVRLAQLGNEAGMIGSADLARRT